MQHSKGAFVDLIFLIPVYHSGADLSSAPGSVDRGADEGALEAGLGQLILALVQIFLGQARLKRALVRTSIHPDK